MPLTKLTFSKIVITLVCLVWFYPELAAGPKPIIQQAKYAFSRRELNKSYQLFEKVRQRDSKNGTALFYMGYIREQQNRRDEAVILYEQALELELEKDLEKKCFWKVVLYYKEAEDWGNLLLYSERFLQIFNHSAVHKLHDLAKRNHSPNFIETKQLYKQAKIYKENKQYTRAIDNLERLLIRDPSHIKARWQLALLHIKIKAFYAAARHLQILIEKKPKNWKYHYKGGVCYYHLGQHKKSLSHLQLAHKHHSNHYRDKASFQYYTNYILGDIYLKQKKFKLSRNHFIQAASAKKPSSFLFEKLARVYWQLKDYKKAVKYATKSVQEEPKQAAGYLLLAMHAYQFDDNEKEAYQMALRMASALENYSPITKTKQSPFEYPEYNFGFLLIGKKEKEEENWSRALKFYRKIDVAFIKRLVRYQPKNKANRFVTLAISYDSDLAMTLMYNGNVKQALDYYKKLEPKADIMFGQARCHALLFEVKPTQRYLEKASTKKPSLWQKAKQDEAFTNLMAQSLEFRSFMQKH